MITETSSIAASAQATTLGKIEAAARTYDRACSEMEDAIAALETDLEAVKSKHLRGLKRLAAAVASAQADGLAAVESNPAIFVKPRAFTIHGVKCGYTTNEGKLICKDEQAAIERIADRADLGYGELVRVTRALDKDAVKALDPKDLKALGCSIEGAGDQPIFRRTASDIEKLLSKLVSKLVEAMGESEAA